MSVIPKLHGRVALVTGASRGIGAAIAFALAEAGADVCVNFRQRAELAAAVVAKIQQMGRHSIALCADVSIGAEVKSLVESIDSSLGPVDILVNNAGIAIQRDLDTLSEADFDQTIAVNLKSAFLCTQAVWPGMRHRGWGRIVNISSGAARGSGMVGLHYNASKAGMEGLTRGYAARLITHGVTVNAVAPSQIATEMIAGLSATRPGHGPIGRLGTPEEVASAVLMVIANGYMSGQTIQLNGGRHFI